MKFSIKQSVLKHLLAKAFNFVSKKDIDEAILQSYLFSAGDNTITVVASDIELSCKFMGEATVNKEKKFNFVLAGKDILSVIEVPNATDEDITFDIGKLSSEDEIKETDYKCTVKIGDFYEGEFAAKKGESFPDIPDFNEEKEFFDVSKGKFLEVLKKAVLSAGIDVERTALMGVYFNEGKVMATNSSKVAVYYEDLGIKDLMLPTPSIANLITTLEAFDEDEIKIQKYSVGEESTHVVVKVGDNTFVSRLLNEKFPYENFKERLLVMEGKKTNTVKISKEALNYAIKRSLAASDRDRGVKVVFYEDRLDIIAKKTSMMSKESVPCTFDGKPGSFSGFNGQFILDVLELMSDEAIVLHVEHEGEFMMIEESNGKYLIFRFRLDY